MNILILNWRDIKNPSSGGAEILTHEMAKRWVQSGNTVIQFSASFPKAIKEEKIDGITFIRKGRWWNVHFFAIFYYFRMRKSIDVVIDEVHWFPFFAALYAPKKTVALTCEVASKLLFRIFPYPIALFFFMLEKIYLFLYRKVPTMVISPSTQDDLIKAGVNKSAIEVIPMGISIPNSVALKNKESELTIISISRLNKQKGILDLIEMFKIIHSSIPASKLWLVGEDDGGFKKNVERKIAEYNLKESVVFFGFVSEREKFSLLARAHVLVSASTQEGWGLTIPEAGLVKTPSVVYNIPGFRDIIVQSKTGYLVNPNPESLAEKVLSVVKNKNLYMRLQNEAQKQAKTFTWDSTAKISMKFIKQSLK